MWFAPMQGRYTSEASLGGSSRKAGDEGSEFASVLLVVSKWHENARTHCVLPSSAIDSQRWLVNATFLQGKAYLGMRMIYKYKKDNARLAKVLRKNMTRQEKHIWFDFLKKLPITVKRQRPFGNYIADFFIPSASLVIEIDGRQHQMEENKIDDLVRDKYFNEIGICVIRYTNADIDNNFHEVCNQILDILNIPADKLKNI